MSSSPGTCDIYGSDQSIFCDSLETGSIFSLGELGLLPLIGYNFQQTGSGAYTLLGVPNAEPPGWEVWTKSTLGQERLSWSEVG